MRYLIFIISLLVANTAFAQYPELDNHTSIGGAGEWFNQSGHANMGVEGGTVLCYNIGVSYTNSQQYIWESSDYGTQFVDDGLDSVRFSVNLTLDIRSNGDLFYMGYYDGGTWTDFLIPYRQVLSWTTFYVWAPNTATKFRYRLFTGGNGTTNGKFVHIQWTELESNINVLPVELLTWQCERENNNILFKWVTASEINNDKFEILFSENTNDWKVIGEVDGAGNSNSTIEYYYVYETTNSENYFKLKQIDFDGNYEEFKILYVNIPREEIIEKKLLPINILGQNGYYHFKKSLKDF